MTAPSDYCTLAEVKSAFPDVTWGTSYDTLLTEKITEASRSIDLYCNRKPGAFYVSVDGTPLLYSGADAFPMRFGNYEYPAIQVDDLAVAPTLVELSPTGNPNGFMPLAATDYWVHPRNAADRGHPYWAIVMDILWGSQRTWYWFPNNIRVTGKFGYAAAIPPEVKEVAILETARLFKRAQTQYQDVVQITDQAQTVYKTSIDPDVAKKVLHLRRASF